MGKYRKKPVVVEAWRIGSFEPRPEWINSPHFYGDGRLYMEVETLEGRMRGEWGDWLIRGAKGEVYPCKNDIFEATYEPVQDNEKEG